MSPLLKGAKAPYLFVFLLNPRPKGRGNYIFVSIIIQTLTPSFRMGEKDEYHRTLVQNDLFGVNSKIELCLEPQR